ncbi:hypothetical protein LV161_008855 [Aspergillus fumigatus]|nr:hypothetical protein LV161_008855 [Aspergillus fumigatus]
MPPTIQTPYWCFTLNNPGDARVPYDPKIVQYLCYQLEEGESKTPHYQGFVQFVDKKTTLKRAKQFLGDRYHLEAMKATDPLDAIRYTKKEKGRLDGPWEHGELLLARSNKRKRSQMEADYDADSRAFKLVRPDDAIQIEIDRMTRDFEENAEKYSLAAMDRPWQKTILAELSQAPDDRIIHWVYGPAGGEGKSTFAKSLARSGWAYILPRGLSDMTYQWARQGIEKNVVVDIERRVSMSHYDAIYSFIEMVKNRVISNTKYRSAIGFMRLDVHVVVVTNVMFDDQKITRGRMCLHDLSVAKQECRKIDVSFDGE